MRRGLDEPPVFRLDRAEGGRFDLVCDGPERAHVFVLEDDIIRVAVLPAGGFAFPRSWAIAPGEADVALEGRERLDVGGFATPDCHVEQDELGLTLATARLRLRIRWRGLLCQWDQSVDGAFRHIAADRATQAYDFGWWDGKVRHYLQRREGEAFYGLGECSGPMDRAGRRVRLGNRDALGYDAETSQPLYKHIPFHLTRAAGEGGCFGLFYDTYADCAFDFGCERSNYHGLFRSFEARSGDLDYYVIAGPAPLEVVGRFTWMTGRPAATADWMLGYSGSGMAYADADDAPHRIATFVDEARSQGMAAASFHLSSGYAMHGARRHVFAWNRERFPDPAGFAAALEARGVKLIPNAKPCLMRDHPAFEAAASAGLFICEPDGRPHLVQFWGELGALLDFTNPATIAWWKNEAGEALLAHGAAAVWNDNNEFEIASPEARIHGFGRGGSAAEARPLQSLLMMRASFEAQRGRDPSAGPVVSRAGAAGMQRYAQTWSGDNATAWKTLRYNSRMGLGLSLSGVSNLGHDIGGFSGPAPGPELLARWVAAGLLLPRFSIHSWNDDGSTTEPWMHPQAAPAIRTLMALRGRFIPYLSQCLAAYRDAYEPVLRPLFVDFPDDPASWEEGDAFMVGRAVLASPVFDEGVESLAMTLPRQGEWRDFWSGETVAAGARIIQTTPWDRTPLFVRTDVAEAALVPSPR
ncbi:MAG TPA: glycoside hydrolase family 31 protein [Caulobacteraceae bacterium]|nr:glycoside hydrolase family 31 protein [Caulobacteraceae bacterium]